MASSASASTLAYVKDGAVWVSAPDGSDAHQVATELTYPALADNGTVYALTATGQVDVLPPGVPAQSPISITATNPIELSVSASGSNLAWTDQTQASESGREVSILRLSDRRRTMRLSDQWPHWLSDTQVTMGGANGGELFDAASNTPTLPWPESYTPPGDVAIDEYAINRAGTVGAGVVDYGSANISSDPDAHSLVVFPVAGDAPATSADQFCLLDNSYPDPIEVADTAFSPDGTILAWQESDGIHETSIPAKLTNCNQIPDARLVIPAGSEPALGASDDRRFPEPTAPGPPVPPGPPPVPVPPGPGPVPPPGPPHIVPRLAVLSLPHRLTAAAFVEHGLTLHLKCLVTGALTVTAAATETVARRHHLPQTTVGAATVRVRRAGPVTLVVHPTKRDRKPLRRAAGIPLTITLHIHSLHTTARLALR